jgi:hypothetical protein
MINKYTSYIMVMQCWNTGLMKGEMSLIAKMLKTADLKPGG